MRPSTLFVPAHAGQSIDALDAAIGTAVATDAHLRVAAFAQSPSLPVATPYDMGGFSESAWSQEVGASLERVRAHAEGVRLALDAAGARGDVDASLVERAQIDALVGMHAAFADIALVPATLKDEMRRRVVNGALFLSAAPVLLLGEEAIDLGALRRIVIGWDGGVAASAAARAVLPLLRRQTRIELVLVDPIADSDAFGAEPGAQAAGWLARLGPTVDVVRLPHEGRPVAETIIRHAGDVDADLLVMGGYGHSRLRERVFGGTTRSVVDEADRPVLLAR